MRAVGRMWMCKVGRDANGEREAGALFAGRGESSRHTPSQAKPMRVCVCVGWMDTDGRASVLVPVLVCGCKCAGVRAGWVMKRYDPLLCMAGGL